MEDADTAIERRVAEIWANVLEVSHVARDDDFFELGGNSLLAMSIIERVDEEWEVEVLLYELLESSTVAAFSRVIRQRVGTADVPPQV
jgi:acyl carrier protein